MPSSAELFISSPEETTALGSRLASELRAGDTVLLSGPLGAGKTTLVRGILMGLGYTEPVRSPTFNLIQVFNTNPPVMHADLYRLGSHEGLGIEDYLDSHLCLIEWPDRAVSLRDPDDCWQVDLSFQGQGRLAKITKPGNTWKGGLVGII